MPIVINDRESHAKSVPGLVDVTAEGIVIHAQTVRLDRDVYEVPETIVPITWPGEPAKFRVTLTPRGLARVIGYETRIPDETIDLAQLTLKSEADTPLTVDVEVLRVTLVPDPDRPLPEPTIHVVPAVLIVPEETPERAAARARRARCRAPLDQVRGRPPSTWTDAEMRGALAALLRERGVDVPDEPGGGS